MADQVKKSGCACRSRGRRREDVPKHRTRGARAVAEGKESEGSGANEDEDRAKASLFRAVGPWLLLPCLLPGHHYLGPGSALCRGKPVDQDDRIAQEHERDYRHARTWQDVRRADRAACRKFWRDIVTTWNWHSIIGLFIVLVKFVVESVIRRPLYPSLPRHRGVACIQGKVVEAGSKDLLQGPPPPGCPCPAGSVGPTPQETPGHRMSRPPSPSQYFLYTSDSSSASSPDPCEEPTPYTTHGHRMSRPPSPPRVFMYDVPTPECTDESSFADSSYAGSSPTDASSASEYHTAESSFADTSCTPSSPGSHYYTPRSSPPARGCRAPVAESSPAAICPQSYSPGLSPVSPITPGLNATYDADCPNTTFDMGRANATFDAGRANETYVWQWEDSNEMGIFDDITLEDDVFEPPEAPRSKRRPPPLVIIKEELNETFTMQAPGQGFMDANPQSDIPQNTTFEMDCPQNTTFDTDCPQNATFEMDCPHNTTFDTDCPQNATFETGCPQNTTASSASSASLREVIDESLMERIAESQQRVRAIITRVQNIVASRECDRQSPNRTY